MLLGRTHVTYDARALGKNATLHELQLHPQRLTISTPVEEAFSGVLPPASGQSWGFRNSRPVCASAMQVTAKTRGPAIARTTLALRARD